MRFLTNRPQSVKLDNLLSSTLTLKTGMPQGCVPSLLLYSFLPHDWVPLHGSNTKIKFATTSCGRPDPRGFQDGLQGQGPAPGSVVCQQQSGPSQPEYQGDYCRLHTQKTKEIVVDFRQARSHAHPLSTSTELYGCVSRCKKVRQSLYFLQLLKKACLCPTMLVYFNYCTIKSILASCISVWYGSCFTVDPL